MIVERFSQNIIGSGVLRLYMATGFFASMAFFILNITLFSPMEIMVYMAIITVALKGLSNLMLGFVIALFNISNKEDELHHSVYGDKINSLVSELTLKEQNAQLQKSASPQ